MWNPSFDTAAAAPGSLLSPAAIGLCLGEDSRRHVLETLLGRHLSEGELSMARMTGPGPERWKMVQDEDGNWVYRNMATGEVQQDPPPGWEPDPNHPWVRVQDPDGSWSYCNVTTGEKQSAPPDSWAETNPNHPWVRVQNAAGEWVYSNVETGVISQTAPAGWLDVLPLTKEEQSELMGQLLQYYQEEELKAERERELAERGGLGVGDYASMLNAGLKRQRSPPSAEKSTADGEAQTDMHGGDMDVLLALLDAACSDEPSNILTLVDHILQNKNMLQVVKQQLKKQEPEKAAARSPKASIANAKNAMVAFGLDGEAPAAAAAEGASPRQRSTSMKMGKAGLALSMTGAFQHAHEQRKTRKKISVTTKIAASKSFGGMMLKSRDDRRTAEQIVEAEAEAYAIAHARDFTVKEWEKSTKHLTG